ncbi:MAG: leucine-rich repeat domain-containing protein [Deltaproteobacteria bacterium]|nr:leucine-rich repeat domain-containing protein [Deltaproteobacteria bacterium]
MFRLSITLALLAGIFELSGCARYGFTPDDTAYRDAGDASVSLQDAGSAEVVGIDDVNLAQDQSVHDAPRDQAIESTPDATNSGWQLLFVLHTTSMSPETFTPSATKSGDALRWELGDSTIVDANTVNHSYGESGEKTIRVLSKDGALGVTQLVLGANELRGSIPPEFGELPSLEYLNVFSNQLGGTIPPGLGQLSSLQYLNLSSNQLTGAIPPELGQLSNLETLYLGRNPTAGEIPPELGQLASLQLLSLRSNQLIAGVPPELGQLSSLQILDVSDNQLGGQIPSELGQLANLERLHLNSNQLTGRIPTELGQLSQLRYLHLFSNNLTDTIPAELGNISGLWFLHLESNQLTGTIPSNLSRLSVLSSLRLNSNQLTGYSSGAFVGLRNLRTLSLQDNLLDQIAVDAIISDIYQARDNYPTEAKILDLGGTNAAPGAAARGQVDELRANFAWTIICNGC